MEFFVFLNKNPAYTLLFRITPTESEITIKTVVDEYAKIIQKTQDESFDSNNFRVFINNYTQNYHNVVQEVTDLNKSIFKFSSIKFDLILSEENIDALAFSAQSTNSKSTKEELFDEAVLQATIAINSRDSKLATSNIKKAINLNPSSSIPYQLQVKMYFKFHRYKSALDFALSAYRHFPNDSDCLYLLGKAEQKLDHHNDAIEYFKRLLLLPLSSGNIDYTLMNFSIANSLYELGEYENAYNLVQPIFKNDPLNLKAGVLLAKILFKKGLYHDAIHIIINNFSIVPDHKQSIKFIGHYVCNERQIKILKDEIGDSINNPHITFFIGHILYKYGSCKAAHSFFMESFKKSSFDSSIFIGTFKNLMVLNEDFNVYFDLILQYLKSLAQQKNDFSLLVSPEMQFINDFKENNFIIPNILPFKENKVECKFKLNQLDIIWALIVIESFLFLNGFISNAQIIGNNLHNMIDKYDFSNTVIDKEFGFHNYVINLIQTIPKPLPEYKKFFVIGDEHCLTLAWRTIKYMNEDYLLVPVVIEGLHPTDLIDKNFSSIHFAYINKIKTIPIGSNVIFASCEIDCRDWLLTFNGKTEIYTLDEVLKIQMESLINAIINLVTTNKFKVWVHPMYYMPVGTLEIVQSFNQFIETNIINLKNDNIKFINILNKMLIEVEDNIIFNKEYSKDGEYLNANYIKLVEESMN